MGKNSTSVFDVVVIGAGASGMMAAITAARNNKRILLLEKNEKLGKKILATGNGKCNYTNEQMDSSFYYGEESFVSTVLNAFSNADAISFFKEIGVYPKNRNGYYYPNSEQAASVVNALAMELEQLGVVVKLNSEVEYFERKGTSFLVYTSNEVVKTPRLIISTGLKANPKLGSGENMIQLLQEKGHHIVTVLPSLCGFVAKGFPFKKVSGVRVDCKLSIYVNGECKKEERGELQLADYGISGIPVFQISHYGSNAIYQEKSASVIIDFLPDFTKQMLLEELIFRKQKLSKGQKAEQFLNGLLHTKLALAILEKATIASDKEISLFLDDELERIANAIKQTKVELIESRDFEFAQVCLGGISLEEIDSESMMSKMIPGLYLTGEIMDVDGICGGYNLQWAWATGYIAGKHTGQKKK